jgi:uncharacterized protein (TIGR02246 family)
MMRSVRSDDTATDIRDALAIRALSEGYAQAVDSGDSAAFVSVFAPDGHLVSNFGGAETHFYGREELAQIPARAKDGSPTTMHFIGNHTADVNGDTATGVTYCIANHLREDRSNMVLMLRYLDSYRRDPDYGWLIADRRVDIQWTETRQADPPPAT